MRAWGRPDHIGDVTPKGDGYRASRITFCAPESIQ